MCLTLDSKFRLRGADAAQPGPLQPALPRTEDLRQARHLRRLQQHAGALGPVQ
uniref:Uncharacterized protein n=1 Tax=Anguilla anguilla TaxID=7936 RepID=A0A0E9XGC9_ANGAN